MTVKPFSHLRDFEEITSWIRPYSDIKEPLPKEFLSKTGFIAEENGQKLAVAWLVMTNAQVAWVRWIVGNPKISKEKRSEALDTLIDVIKQEAKEQGYVFLLSLANMPVVSNRFKKHGFIEGDSDMTQYIVRL